MEIITRKQAIEAGLTRYFTGKPCKRGHIAERTVSGKCVTCTTEYNKKYHKENRDAMLEQQKKYHKENREAIAERQKKYREDNRDEVLERMKKWRETYPKKAKAHNIVNNAIKSGKMGRVKSCSECGSGRHVEAHHDDYDKPLDVRWLCRSCHRQWHSENGEAKNAL